MPVTDSQILDQSAKPPTSKLLLLILGLQIALFLSFIDSTSVSTILPVIGNELDAAESITWAGTAFLVANTSFQIVTSRLSDCFGRKIVLISSL
jgi:MFS family permease